MKSQIASLIYQIKFIGLFCFLIYPASNLKAQSNYRDFLRRDSSQQNSFLMGGYNFLKVPHSVNFRADGLYFHLGFNVARFVSKKIILGVCIDHKGAKGIFGWNTGSAFASEFSLAYSPLNGSQADSAKSQILYNALTSPTKKFVGNYIANIGIMFSPFPQKYGGILIELKRGGRSFPIDGNYGNPYINNDGSEFAFLDVRKVYCGSIYFKPFTLSKKSVNDSFEKTVNEWRHKIIVGFHYERLNLSDSDFYGVSIPQLVSTDFMSKHGIEHRFGFSLGFGIY